MRRPQTIDAYVYAQPDPVVVALILATKGADAAAERWHWCEPRTIATLARIGRARTGMAPKGSRVRTSALTGRQAIAVEAAAVLDSLTAVNTVLGVPVNSTRSALQSRGLPVPRNAASRNIEGQIGRRILRGDETAIAEREARRVHARAVCSVLEAALALVPEQPHAGRFRLPPVDDALRAALAGMPASAVRAVFPSLSAE